MSSSNPRVLVNVTFVGGPLHGLRQALDAPTERFWRDLPDGTALLYARRWISSEAPVTGTPVYAVYSPVGMSEHAYRELLSTVDLEPHVSAHVSAPAAKRNTGTP
jgi:hypothetical protein